MRGEPNVSYICSRYYRAPELIFGATDYTCQIGNVIVLSSLSSHGYLWLSITTITLTMISYLQLFYSILRREMSGHGSAFSLQAMSMAAFCPFE